MRYSLLIILSLIFLGCEKEESPACTLTPPAPDYPEEYAFEKSVLLHDTTQSSIPYYFFKPRKTFHQGEQFPLILALHGIEYFASPEDQFLHVEEVGYFALGWLQEEKQLEYPAFVVAPHIYNDLYFGPHYNNEWSSPLAMDFVDQLLEKLMVEYPQIDVNRIYVAGHSAGGFGSWWLGAKWKTKLAAIVPMSSAFASNSPDFDPVLEAAEEGTYSDLPVWSFIHRVDADGNSSSSGEHGCRVLFQQFEDNGYDPVRTHEIESGVDLPPIAIEQEINNGNIHFYTEYNYSCSVDCHFAMTQALKEDLLWKWLFQQQKAP